MPRDTYAGWITPERAAERAKLWRSTLPPDQAAERIEIDRLLTMRPVRASLTAAEGSPADDDEFASLWPPTTRAEAEQREHQHQRRIAASKPQDDDDIYRAIFGEDPPR